MDTSESPLTNPKRDLGSVLGLCLDAIARARTELEFEEPEDAAENFANVILADTLGAGFSASASRNVIDWDASECQAVLLRFEPAQAKIRSGLQVGKKCLFTFGHETWSKPGRQILSDEQTSAKVVALGSMSFLVVAAYTPDHDVTHETYQRMSRQFRNYGRLIGHAGMLMGFHRLSPHLLQPAEPIVTIDDFLEVLTAFGRSPDRQHWQLLKTAFERHRVIDDTFNFTLPPEPVE